MKITAVLITAALLLGLMGGCAETTQPAATAQPSQPAASQQPTQPTQPSQPTQPTQPSLPEDGQYITGDTVDLRQMAVDYMYAMANLQWTAGPTLDYSQLGASNLIYETGKTYLGMVYNNNATGLEQFYTVLDENNRYIGTDTNWVTSPGNSCATSIRHAWEKISATVNFTYSADMMPCYRYSGVVAVGDIDWSAYDRTHTKTVIEGNPKEVILQAYAMTLPADALVRHLGDAGGHALMVTKPPQVSYNADGTINAVNSYLFLTDQNSMLNNRREYPSSWLVDNKVSFADALRENYLPVTVAELRDGRAPVPEFSLTGASAEAELASGVLNGSVTSNYCISTLSARVMCDGQIVAQAQIYPYARTVALSQLSGQLALSQLPSGTYTLTVTAETGLATQILQETTFTK